MAFLLAGGPSLDSRHVLDLSPTKLLIIFVVAVVLLGPKRLPQVARQLGAAWRRLRDFGGQLDSQVREHVPDLPSSQELVRFARSPAAFLDRLAQLPEDGADEDGVATDPPDLTVPLRRAGPISRAGDTDLRLEAPLADDPSLN